MVPRIVLLTDGQEGHPLRRAIKLKKRGGVIDVTGVGPSPDGVDEKLLRKVASVVVGETRYRFYRDHQTRVQPCTQPANNMATST